MDHDQPLRLDIKNGSFKVSFFLHNFKIFNMYNLLKFKI